MASSTVAAVVTTTAVADRQLLGLSDPTSSDNPTNMTSIRFKKGKIGQIILAGTEGTVGPKTSVIFQVNRQIRYTRCIQVNLGFH